MAYTTPAQLHFPPLPGYPVRADCAGGALSSDFGALVWRGLARQIGLTARLAAARRERRPPSSIAHPWRALLAQRIEQIAAGSADGKDANSLRHAPLLQLSVERVPRDPAQALVDHCIASDSEPPAALGLAPPLPYHPYPGPWRQAWRDSRGERRERAPAAAGWGLGPGGAAGVTPPGCADHAGGAPGLAAADRWGARLWRAAALQSPRGCGRCRCRGLGGAPVARQRQGRSHGGGGPAALGGDVLRGAVPAAGV
jgi:hypothetical protein